MTGTILKNATEKLADLRAELASRKLDGFIVPHEDEFQNEYVPPSSDRLAWLTDFTGSAGCAIVLKDKAIVMSDSRYTEQLKQQVNPALFVGQDTTDIAAWLSATAAKGSVIGYDPWHITEGALAALKKSLRGKGVTLAAVNSNPVDAVWSGRPAAPASIVEVFPETIAGRSAADKIKIVSDAVKANNAAAFILPAPQSIAWMLNIRATDVAHTPLALSYLVVHEGGNVDWYIDPARVPQDVRMMLGNNVSLRAPQDLKADMATLAQAAKSSTKPVLIDFKRTPSWFKFEIEAQGGVVEDIEDPCLLPRACKTDAEQKSIIDAHVRDGVAMVRFLKWLDDEAPKGKLTEMDVADKLEGIRRLSREFRDSSFDTISGWAANGAVVHYRATPSTNKPIIPPGLLLVDSGAQYQDGTTDITRTIAVGAPTDEMKRSFTRVLQGHIGVATARFQEGTVGAAIDSRARGKMWDDSLVFGHGTGHGVGCYLSVHEEAASISPIGQRAFKPGMLISNEPGLYKSGEYGIRIENLILVKTDGKAKKEFTNKDINMLVFDTITLAPIDNRLIVPDLMDEAEIKWLNDYHERVYKTLAPLVEPDVAAWLKAATVPLHKASVSAGSKPATPHL